MVKDCYNDSIKVNDDEMPCESMVLCRFVRSLKRKYKLTLIRSIRNKRSAIVIGVLLECGMVPRRGVFLILTGMRVFGGTIETTTNQRFTGIQPRLKSSTKPITSPPSAHKVQMLAFCVQVIGWYGARLPAYACSYLPS
jgi:hypothetical protein